MNQVEIASFAINYCEAKNVYITRGTPYHVGYLEEWEDAIAKLNDFVANTGIKYLEPCGLLKSGGFLKMRR